MRIVFMGTPEFSVPVLEALLAEEILDIEADLLRALVHCGEAGLASSITSRPASGCGWPKR